MEMIRSWRTLSFGGLGRAALERIRAWRILHFTKWAIAILLIGMLTGAMAVIFPPMASIGVVALVGVVLLWAMPDLHTVPDKLLRRMFFAMAFVLLCVPAYYAIDTGVLPWISVRRFFAFAVIILFAIAYAGSQSARDKVSDTLRDNKLLTTFVVGFLVMIFLSILTSRYPTTSLKELVDSMLNWYVPLFACILIVRTESDVIFLFKIIAIACVVDSALGFIEFLLQRRYYFDLFPKSILDSMMAINPALSAMYYTSTFRNGFYRASSIYTVPLSFGELAAMAAPIGAYFVFHGQKFSDHILGVLTILGALLALFCSGARGAYMAFLVSMPIMLLIWTIRHSRLNPHSLLSAIMAAVFTFGFAAVLGLVLFWQRAYNIVFGGGDTVASTEARVVQWNLARPHIISNPITGHGAGTSADVIGYYGGGALPTVDSYVLSLLVETGVPGLVFFFGMVGLGIWIMLRLYLTNRSTLAAIGGPIACSLIAFSVYRTALSQRENHTLLFLIIGLVFAISKLSYEHVREKRYVPGMRPRSNASYPTPVSRQPVPYDTPRKHG